MLKRIHLVNACQYRDKVAEFGPGLTVVVGPQGSGKSNMFTMTLATLTNDIALYGVKKDNIRRGVGKKDESYFEAVWERDGKSVQVRRQLKKGSSALYLNGKRVDEARHETQITAGALEALQCSKEAIVDYCYVTQGQTDALLREQPGDRRRFMAKFLDQSWVLELEGKVKDAALVVATKLGTDYLAELAQVKLTREGAKATIKRLTDELTYKRDALRCHREYLDSKAAVTQNLTRLKSTQQELADLRNNYQQRYQRRESLKTANESDRGLLGPLDARLVACQHWANVIADNDQREAWESQTAELSGQIAQLNEQLIPPPVQAKPALSQEEIDGMAVELATVVKRIALLTSGVSVCDKCGSPVEAKPGELDDCHEARGRLTRQLQQARSDKQLDDDYQAKLRHYLEWKPKLESRLRAAEEQLKTLLLEEFFLPEIVEIGESYNPADREVDLVRMQAEYSNRISNRDGEIASITELLPQLVERGERLAKEVSQMQSALDVSALAEIEQKKDAAMQLELEIAETSRQLGAAESASAGSEAAIDRLVVAVQQQSRFIQGKEALLELQDAMKPKNYPAKVLQHLFGGIAKQMTALCGELGEPYEVTVSEDLEFMVRHPDGSLEPARRLSGGQRACLSTVFWLVRLLSRARSSLPLLILDEPSAHMDADAVANFGAMLQRLNPYLVQRNLQVVLITHHQQLAGCGAGLIRTE